VLGPYEHSINDVLVSPDGMRILTRTTGVPVVAPEPDAEAPAPTHHQGPPKITCTLRSIYGTKLATQEYPWDHAGPVFRAPHQALYLDIFGSELHVKDFESGQVVKVIPHDSDVASALFSTSADRIVSTCDEHTVVLSSADEGETKRFRAGPLAVRRVAFTPDDSRIVTTYADGTVGVWNLEGTPVGTPQRFDLSGGTPPSYEVVSEDLIVAVEDMQVGVYSLPHVASPVPTPVPTSVPPPGEIEVPAGDLLPPVRPLHPAAPTPVAPAAPAAPAAEADAAAMDAMLDGPPAPEAPPAPTAPPAEEVVEALPAPPAFEVVPPGEGARLTAPRLATGLAHTVRLTIPQESRWLRFDAVPGKWHTIETRYRSLQDTVLLLHDSSGEHLATDDDGGKGNMSRIVRRLDAGTHYVRVLGFGNHVGICEVVLTVTDEEPPTPVEPAVVVVEEAPPAAPAEPAAGRRGEPRGEAPGPRVAPAPSTPPPVVLPDEADRANATLLPPDNMHTLTIHVADCHHWYRIEGDGSWCMIETYAGTISDTVLYLHGHDGTHIATSDDEPQSQLSRIVHRLEKETYFLRARAHASTETGTFRIQQRLFPVRPVPPYPANIIPVREEAPPVAPDETEREEATPLGSAGEITATIEEAGGGQWFRIEAEAGRYHVIETTAASFGDTVLHLHSGDGTHIVTNDDGGRNHLSRIGRVLDAGTYYVRVRAYKPEATGTFTIRLRITDEAPPPPPPVTVPAGLPPADPFAPGAAPAVQAEQFPPQPSAFEALRLVGHTGDVSRVVASPDGEGLLTTSWDGTVRLWRMSPPGEVPVPTNVMGRTLHLAADGKLVLASFNDRVEFWTAAGHKLAERTVVDDSIRCIGWDDDTKYVAVGTNKGHVHLFRANGDPLEEFPVHEGSVQQVTFMASPEPAGEPRVVSYGDDKCVCIREITTDSEPVRIQHNPYRPSGFAVAPSGGYVVTYAHDWPRDDTMPKDYGLFLWDAEGNPLTSLAGHGEACERVGISPDGEQVLTMSIGSVMLWSRRGEEIARYEVREGVNTDAFFSPDGVRIFEGDQAQGITTILRMDGTVVDVVRTPPPAERHYESKGSGVASPCAPPMPGSSAGPRLPRTKDGSKILVELDAGSISVMTHDGVELFGLPGGGDGCGGVEIAEFSGPGNLLYIVKSGHERLLQLDVPALIARVEEVVSRGFTEHEKKVFRSLLEHRGPDDEE
jgi:WD40 repeat protein